VSEWRTSDRASFQAAGELERRAVDAWWQLGTERVWPRRIDILKSKRKTAVFRLAGAGPEGEAVIAKRCRSETARVERVIYEEFFPRLPVPALHCYGFLREPEGRHCWLFLEEACGREYSPLIGEHRLLAGQWLAAVHTASLQAGLDTRLPAREPDHYLESLRSSRKAILQHLSGGKPEMEEAGFLEGIVACCGVIESHWGEMERACEVVPRALVHGDLVVKNVRVRRGPAGAGVLVFDWENAGWGVMATDFAQFTGRTLSPDLPAYCSAVNGGPLELGLERIRQLAACGRLFRLIDDLRWASSSLAGQPQENLARPLSQLRHYGCWMSDSLRAARWTG